MILSRSRRLGALGAVVLVVFACSDAVRVSGPHGARANGLFDDPPYLGLVSCHTMDADSVSQTVGPDGGTIHVGSHTLTIPPGALDSSVVITAVAPSDTVRRVTFQPEGLTFNQPAQLMMNSAGCDLLGSLAPKSIAYLDGSLNILEYLVSLDNLLNHKVTGTLHHFSDYAIAW